MRRREPGNAASSVPIAMIAPPIHSHRIIGLTNTRIVAVGVAGSGALAEREVDVLGEAGAHRRGADVGADVEVRRGGRPVRLAAVEDDVGRDRRSLSRSLVRSSTDTSSNVWPPHSTTSP